MSATTAPIAQPDSMLERRIRQYAYELYEVRVHGSDLQDWLQAECEVLHEITCSKSKEPAAAPSEAKIAFGKTTG
jgi:Protein of unknown function (DUF2934)